MKHKYLIVEWLAIVLSLLGLIGYAVYSIDPYMHFHKPNIEEYYYTLYTQRYQNDGIIRNFDYDALISGSSMVENFNTSEIDRVFGVRSVKVPFNAGSYKEINDNIARALRHNPHLKMVIRCLDMYAFLSPVDFMRYDLNTYPWYLYDDNPLNDVEYLFNRDVLFERILPMCLAKKQDGFKPGITAFDDYATWHTLVTFGKESLNVVAPDPDCVKHINDSSTHHLIDEDKAVIKENIAKNVTSLADQYPNVEFYYFFPPYSALWWGEKIDMGDLCFQIESEQYVIELLLEHKNIKLFSFNLRNDITTDLNNYKDSLHFGPWIDSLLLKWMREGKYQLTKDNYRDYIAKELDLYANCDYNQFVNQPDYEVDLYPTALFNEELTGKKPKVILKGETSDNEVRIDDITGYDYLAFYAKDYGDGLFVLVLDGSGRVFFKHVSVDKLAKWHLIFVELDKVDTKDLVIRNTSGERSGVNKGRGLFRDITLY